MGDEAAIGEPDETILEQLMFDRYATKYRILLGDSPTNGDTEK